MLLCDYDSVRSYPRYSFTPSGRAAPVKHPLKSSCGSDWERGGTSQEPGVVQDTLIPETAVLQGAGERAGTLPFLLFNKQLRLKDNTSQEHQKAPLGKIPVL